MTDPRNPPIPLDGILLVDKPAKRAVSSMTVCRVVRRALRRAGYPKRVKVGHAGTLDPLASGLMIVLVGKATRLCERLMAAEKSYLADVDFSRFSPTDDLEAETTANDFASRPGFSIPTADALQHLLDTRFTGVIQQRPPAHSAIMVEGERAYKLARKGDLTELPARPTTIYSCRVTDFDWPRARLDISCGKGTYIRSLARDLGLALTGSPAVLAALRRTRSGGYSVDHATPLEELPEVMTQSDLLEPPELCRDATCKD